MINFNNGVTNILGTPGILTLDNSSQLPLASNVAVGTIAIYTFDGNKVMVQSDGSNWLNFSGGTGTVYGISDVLAVGQPFNVGKTIDTAVNDFYIYRSLLVSTKRLVFSSEYTFFGDESDDGYGLNFNKLDQIITLTSYKKSFDYLKFEFNNATNKLDFAIGDRNTLTYGMYISVNSQTGTAQNFSIGSASTTYFNIDEDQSYTNWGMDINAGNLTIRKNGAIEAYCTRFQFSSNLKTATAGGASGQHLIIYIGGIEYKIALLNP